MIARLGTALVGFRWAGLAGLLTFTLAWHVASLRYPPVVLPSPLETARALADLALGGELTVRAAQTTWRALAGFALAAALGAGLGIAAGLNPLVRAAIWPVVSIFQGVPPIAFIVLALIWFGLGGAASVFTVFIVTLPFAFLAAVEGVRAADPGLLEMARAFRAPPALVLREVYLPGLVSYLFPTLVSGLAVAWKVAVMAEVLGADGGIGAGLALARVNLDTARAMAWIVAVVALLFAFEYLVLHPVKRRLEPWRADRDRPGRPARDAGSAGTG